MSRNENRTRLYKLLNLLIENKISIESFCRDFEHAYNFEVATQDLRPEEERVFSELFDIVAWYTPVAAERAELPTHMKDDEAVINAVHKAWNALCGQ